jgi:hypothetical protein
MTKEFMRKVSELDDAAERAGGFVALPTPNSNKTGYDYPAIMKYCKSRGIIPSSLSADELASFRTR